VPSFPDCLPGS